MWPVETKRRRMGQWSGDALIFPASSLLLPWTELWLADQLREGHWAMAQPFLLVLSSSSGLHPSSADTFTDTTPSTRAVPATGI